MVDFSDFFNCLFMYLLFWVYIIYLDLHTVLLHNAIMLLILLFLYYILIITIYYNGFLHDTPAYHDLVPTMEPGVA